MSGFHGGWYTVTMDELQEVNHASERWKRASRRGWPRNGKRTRSWRGWSGPYGRYQGGCRTRRELRVPQLRSKGAASGGIALRQHQLPQMRQSHDQRIG